MLIRLQQWARHSTASALFIAIFVVLAPPIVSAQEQQESFAVTFKNAIFDPTTYVPATIAYDATMRDWSSSQPFFRNGYLERNERYTISGRPNDIPMGYAVGQRRILWDAVQNLQVSLVHNVAGRTIERKLTERYPHRRKLVRTLGWVERICFASYLSYRLSAAHYRQAAANERGAAQLKFR